MVTTTTDRRQGVNSSAAVKVPCRAATTANITLSAPQTIDGVAVVANDRVLVKNQTDPIENGIYDVNATTWTRAPDWDGAYDVKKGTSVRVTSGSANQGEWYVITANPIVPGTTSISFSLATIDSYSVIVYTTDVASDSDTPNQYTSTWYDSNKVAGSGTTWTFTGTTTSGNAGLGLHTDGYVYNANGDQYASHGAPRASAFGSLGDDSTDNSVALQTMLTYMLSAGIGEFELDEGIHQYATGLTYHATDTSDTNKGITIKGRGRRTSILKYTGTSGFGITIKGTTLDLTRDGIIEGITFKDIGYKGTGKSSGNTDSGLYIQAFNHFMLDNALITDFGQDCMHLDRLYYDRAPDAGLDDRGAFVHLKDSEISFAGRHNLIAGGLNSANDYSIDHLITENMHIVNAGDTGAKIYTNNYVDICSLFHGDIKGMELYAQNSDILTQNVTMNSPRFEGGQSDCMLDIVSCLSAVIINPFFAGHTGPLPLEQVRIADNASYNVGNVEFRNPVFQQATTAVNVVGTGAVTNVRIVDPTYNTITNEVLNGTSKPVQIIKGNVLERVTGGGAPLALEGSSGDVLTSKLDSDSVDWLRLSNSGKTIFLGNGSSGVDTAIKRLLVTSAAAMACTTHFSVQETQAAMYSGSGTPEGSQIGAVGSTYTRTDGGAGTSFYVKESGGVGNTGWVGK